MRTIVNIKKYYQTTSIREDSSIIKAIKQCDTILFKGEKRERAQEKNPYKYYNK